MFWQPVFRINEILVRIRILYQKTAPARTPYLDPAFNKTLFQCNVVLSLKCLQMVKLILYYFWKLSNLHSLFQGF
jgi:primosomal protein N''